MDNPIIYAYVECRLKNKQSPAIIQRDIERDVGLKIGKDAIYEYIYRFKYDEWFKYLARKKKYNYSRELVVLITHTKNHVFTVIKTSSP